MSSDDSLSDFIWCIFSKFRNEIWCWVSRVGWIGWVRVNELGKKIWQDPSFKNILSLKLASTTYVLRLALVSSSSWLPSWMVTGNSYTASIVGTYNHPHVHMFCCGRGIYKRTKSSGMALHQFKPSDSSRRFAECQDQGWSWNWYQENLLEFWAWLQLHSKTRWVGPFVHISCSTYNQAITKMAMHTPAFAVGLR